MAIDAAEVRVRAAVPIAKFIYLEPDLRRAAGTRAVEGAARDVDAG